MTQELGLQTTKHADSRPQPSRGLVGQNLDHYEILNEIGRGGMSVVYRARDTRLQRDVAIKVLHPFLADREDARRRFEREARAVARLHHPNILEIYDFADGAGGQSYLVTELVEGQTLRCFVDKHALDPPEVAALLGIKLCEALQAAHNQGVVHRDVKPENIMIDLGGTLKLMDFGIAHIRDAASLTATGTLLGSPAHMAPECVDGKNVDERSDQFSVGTILYWMACGKLPFCGKNPHALLKKIVDGRFLPPQQINPRIPDRLSRVIERALARRPEERYVDVAALRDGLLAVTHEARIDNVDGVLRSYVASPERSRAVLHSQVVNAFLQRARDLQARDETAAALAALNRVLALSPGHAQAQQQLDTLQRRMRRSSSRRRLAQIAAGLAGLAGLFGAGHMLLSKPADRGADPAADSASPSSSTTSPPMEPALLSSRPNPPNELSSTEPNPPSLLPAHARANKAPLDRRTQQIILARLPGSMRPTRAERLKRRLSEHKKNAVPKNTAVPSPPLPDPNSAASARSDIAEARSLRVKVNPWADIYVDGQLKVRGSSVATLSLLPGPHKLRFENTYSASELRRVHIAATGPVPEIAVKLMKMKPAYLVVDVDIPAEIKIDGAPKGTAAASRQHPVIVAMPERERQRRLVIEVLSPGHQPYVSKHTFVAGATLHLKPTLIAQSPQTHSPKANSR